MQRTRDRRKQVIRRRLMLTLCASFVLLAAIVAVQSILLFNLFTRKSANVTLTSEVEVSQAKYDNLQHCLDQYQSLDAIKAKAIRLGMHVPDADSVVILSVNTDERESTVYNLDASGQSSAG